jgi:peptidoglycan hydrolase FlgJ
MSSIVSIAGREMDAILTENSSSAARKNVKLHEAAQQFEALMIGEMLKSVRESSSSGWLGSGESSESESTSEFAEAQFAQALARSGGLGLSKMVEQSVGGELANQKE